MEDSVLVTLDERGRANAAMEAFSPLVANLVGRLRERPDLPQAWRPIDTADLAIELPTGVVSAWLFVLRPRTTFPSERHPNSWQRSLALRGRATFELYCDGAWSGHILDGDGAMLTERGMSIPPGVWHRIEVGVEPFVSLSFHTVKADDLIEETCVGHDFSQTRRRLYTVAAKT
jgi:hypothetical protein